RDLFVDGNTFTAGVHATRRPLPGTAEAAVGHRWRHASLEYRVTARGRAYAAQRSPHVTGSIALGWRR
ncbi:MAG TPA: lipid A-modifier LpxR family protein, partial [Longimicrobium sp.]